MTDRPVLYPCGCSHLKVDAGMCDAYAPGGAERPLPPVIEDLRPRLAYEPPAVVGPEDMPLPSDREARRAVLLSVAQRSAGLLDAPAPGGEKQAQYVLLVGDLEPEGVTVHISNVCWDSGRGLEDVDKAAMSLAGAVHSLSVMPGTGAAFLQTFEDALAFLRALRPRG